MKSGAVFFSSWLKSEPLSLLYNPATVARMFGGFASSREAKSASRSEAPSTSHSERATFAFNGIQLQWLESVGHFTPSAEAKALLCREFQCPKILSEPLSLLLTFVTIVK